MATANMEIRVLMLKHNITQAKLGELLGLSQPEISVMLKHEMTRDQKRRIKDAIARDNEKGD